MSYKVVITLLYIQRAADQKAGEPAAQIELLSGGCGLHQEREGNQRKAE